jgi:hypothetical protein
VTVTVASGAANDFDPFDHIDWHCQIGGIAIEKEVVNFNSVDNEFTLSVCGGIGTSKNGIK